jgi:hypothetical protein
MIGEIDGTGSARAPLVIATSNAPILVRNAGVEVPLLVDDAAIGLLASKLAADVDDLPIGHVYLMLEQVCGSFDAALLQLYLRTVDSARHDQLKETYLGNLGLYGLRRASSGNPGSSMLFYLDITGHINELRRSAFIEGRQLLLAICLHRTLPRGITIRVGRACICVEEKSTDGKTWRNIQP